MERPARPKVCHRDLCPHKFEWDVGHFFFITEICAFSDSAEKEFSNGIQYFGVHSLLKYHPVRTTRSYITKMQQGCMCNSA